jgi:hypothetical protein
MDGGCPFIDGGPGEGRLNREDGLLNLIQLSAGLRAVQANYRSATATAATIFLKSSL